MTKYIKAFFYPTVVTYSYKQPKEIVIAKIVEVLNRKVTFNSTTDIKGRFIDSDTFAMNVASIVYTRGVKYGSTLVGQLIEVEKGITEIKIKTKPSYWLYSLFLMAIIFGSAYFYKFIQTSSSGFLFWSIAIIIIGPALSIGLANITNTSILERFNKYIDKELKP